MLRSAKFLTGHRLQAEDGEFGKIRDVLFDEAHWTVRWMVVDTGRWLKHHPVLISPIALSEPDWKKGILPVRMTKEEIESAPPLDCDAPVSRKYEQAWFDTFGWPYYWNGTQVWGEAVFPGALFTREEAEIVRKKVQEAEDEALRSVEEVRGYDLEARDGGIGEVADFLLDDETWTLRYLVADTRKWLPGRKVLIAPDWIEHVSWIDGNVRVDLTREAVQNSPLYNAAEPIHRDYEKRLYDHYGRKVYWT